MRSAFQRGLVAMALATASLAFGQEIMPCKVNDPELQGSYSGGCNDGWADGVGEATGIATYKGGFKAGRKHGRGVKQWPSGDRYAGEFIDDRKDGTGVYRWGRGTPWAGETYSGGFRADRRNGFGVYEWPDGERYAGHWKDDAISGLPTSGMYARSRAYVEHAAAVAIPGNSVCKKLVAGIATQAWVRGTVTAVKGERIAVRIDNAAHVRHLASGMPGTRGDVTWEAVGSWTACQ